MLLCKIYAKAETSYFSCGLLRGPVIQANFFSTVRCVHWIMYSLDSNKIDFTVCSDING